MNSEITTYGLTPEDAKKLSDFLHVRLRDFWLGMHPIIQAKLYLASTSPEEFFSLVDQEYVRFGQGARFQKPKENSWANIIPIAWSGNVLEITQDMKLIEKE